MEIIELATLRDVPILKAGTHKSRNAGAVVITEAEIDEYIEGSNAMKGIVKEAMSTGIYKGNDHIKSGFVPGPLNLHHNDFLDDTMKDRTKGIDWSFGKSVIEGETWLTETFENVPRDVASAIKTEFPFRSVEILPNVKDPETGRTYKGVLRSTAFLNRYTPPAVKGQSDDVHVEFSEGESPVMTLMSSVATNNTTEDEDMADKKTDAMPETGKKEVDVSELTGKLSEKDAKIAELQAEREAEAAELAELKAERKKQSEAIAELQSAQDSIEARELMTAFSGQVLNGNGTKWVMSKAFTDVVTPLLTGVKRSDVMELMGETKPARDVMKDVFQKVVEMAAKGSILVPISELGEVPEQDAEQKDLRSQALDIQKTEGISYAAALRRIQGGK